MHLQTYTAYLAALAAGMLTPGPAIVQALTLGMRHGCRPVVFVALGNVCTTLAQVVVTLYGLSLLGREPGLLRAASLAGAAYIAWLGLALWRSGARRIAPDAVCDRPPLCSLALQGAGVAAVNPKAWGFLGALMPPFAASGMPAASDVALLAAPLCLLAFGGMLAYARFGAFLAGALASPRAAKRFFRAVAVALWTCASYFAVG